MPSGKTHDITTLILTPIIGIGTYYICADIINSIIITLSFLFSGLMFNGDLDTTSKPFYRWKIFRMIWIPYQDMFSHRSIWTHGFFIGTIVRIIYLSPILGVPLYFLNINPFSDIYISYTISVLLGLELGSMSHSILDYLF